MAVVIFVALSVVTCKGTTGQIIGRVAVGAGGALASADAEATAAGLRILRAGGSAADAAVTVALVLAVVHPHWGNLGGGGFAIARFGDEVASLDFRETAPAAATPAMYLNAVGRPVPNASWIGPLAMAGVRADGTVRPAPSVRTPAMARCRGARHRTGTGRVHDLGAALRRPRLVAR
ncbi:MAG: gamma-glutamyltransferase [Acidobacteria bacterium]|nr:gamma-glutamyltransferase [Acidobacteriota bacterium]